MKAKTLSEYIITKCYLNNNPITNMKLQKILYFLRIDYWNKYKEILFNDYFTAWKLGPVIVDVYYDYSAYIGHPIKEKYDIQLENLRNDQKEFINKEIEYLSSMPVWDLIEKSKQSKPWIKAFEKGKGSIIHLPPSYKCRETCKSIME